MTDLTSLLVKKNTLILQFEAKLNENNKMLFNSNQTNYDNSLYNKRIVTESAWSSFKTYFEKLYPNYIKNFREENPTISDAEERLFLCIKINLKTKEIAAMVEVSNDNLKKTRNRLRKRLNLTESEDLDEFVRNFITNT